MKRRPAFLFAAVLISVFAETELMCAGNRVARLPLNPLNNYISAIAQDREGMLWIGTGAGLLKYDGYSYYDFRETDATALSSEHIRCIYADEDGKMWIGTEKGTLVYDNGGFRAFEDETSGSPVKSITAVPGGKILLSTIDGVSLVDPQNGSSVFLRAGSDRPYFRNRRWIRPDRDGNLWTGYSDKLAKISFAGTGADPRVWLFGVDGPVKVLHIDSDNGLYYLAGNDDLYYRPLPADDGYPPCTAAVKLVPRSDVRGVVISGNEVRVVTSYNGIFCFLREVDGALTPCGRFWINDTDHSDISNGVLCAFVDNNGSFLYGTADGLYAEWRGTGGNFHRISGDGPRKLLHNVVSDIFCRDSQTIWVATTKGLDELVYEAGAVGSIHHHELPAALAGNAGNSSFQCICESGGRLWIGTKNGIVLFDPKSGRFETPDALSAYLGSESASFCKTLSAALDGSVWAGMIYGGLFRFKGTSFSRVVFENSDAVAADVYKVLQSSNGDFWVGTKNYGLLRFSEADVHQSGSILKVLDSQSFLKDVPLSVHDIFEDRDGNILVATSAGLYRIGDSPVLLSDRRFGCNKIIQDRSGDYWISSPSGLLWMDYGFGELRFCETGETTFSLLDYNTGAAIIGDGTVFFGGVGGLTFFSPEEVLYKNAVRKVHVSNISVMGRNVSWTVGDRLDLKPSAQHFALTLSTLDYPVDLKQRYYYKVRETGGRWMAVEGNTLSFLNLSPGDYTIDLSCSESGSNPSTVSIHVATPWWRSWWAYCLYALTALLILGSAAAVILSRYRSEYRLRMLFNITHGLRAPLSLMKLPVVLLKNGEESHRGELLDLLDRNADKLSETVNRILELRKIERKRADLFISRIDAVAFLREILDYLEPYFREKGLNLTFSAREESAPLYCDPEKLETIVFNLLQNAFAFTPAGGSVDVSVSCSDCDLFIKVSDTGIGIEEKYHKKIFESFWQYYPNGVAPSEGNGIGLSLVREYVRMHRGSVKVESALGAGASFEVRLPRYRFRALAPEGAKEVKPRFAARYAGNIAGSSPSEQKLLQEKMSSFESKLGFETADERFLRKVEDIIENNISNENFSLDAFAQQAHVSKSILSSRLRTITGYSPMELVRKARLKRAARLLATREYDVTRVSYMVGFSDPRYFATCFKKEFNCTPSNYISK